VKSAAFCYRQRWATEGDPGDVQVLVCGL